MFENAQTKWDRKILTFLTATFNEFDASVTKSRSKVECEQFRNKWHELSTLETSKFWHRRATVTDKITNKNSPFCYCLQF